jgi:hypothetical protein
MAINNNESQKKARNKIPQFKITPLYPMQYINKRIRILTSYGPLEKT